MRIRSLTDCRADGVLAAIEVIAAVLDEADEVSLIIDVTCKKLR